MNITAKAVGQESSKVQKIAAKIKGELREDSAEPTTAAAATETAAEAPDEQAAAPEKKDDNITIGIGNRPGINIGGEEKDMRTRLKDAILESLLQILLLPLQIIATSFTAIIAAVAILKDATGRWRIVRRSSG